MRTIDQLVEVEVADHLDKVETINHLEDLQILLLRRGEMQLVEKTPEMIEEKEPKPEESGDK